MDTTPSPARTRVGPVLAGGSAGGGEDGKRASIPPCGTEAPVCHRRGRRRLAHAGAGRQHRRRACRGGRGGWRSAGLECPFQVVSDLEVAFAAGTPAEDGVVFVSGTGAAAGAVHGARVVRHVDGYGWLLGDDGSGFWLGRQAVRACLTDIDGRGKPTVLTESVLRAFGVPPRGDPGTAVTCVKETVYRRPPVALAELAPLVTTAAGAGDEVAAAIVGRAVDLLISTAEAAVP